jgi:rSAM/selenodomain-associated transferase 2
MAAPRIAVVVPIRNEGRVAPALAERLATLAAEGAAEIAIIDGESDDGGTALLARLLPRAHIFSSPRGRARQMNAGARATAAPILLFLHADTTPPAGALAAIGRAVDAGAGFGCFRLAFDSPDPRLWLAARLIGLRSRLLCSATGDQAIFVRRDLFDAVGGFPSLELCEDLGLMRRLCGRARFALLPSAVRTSARRWERHGVLRTFALMWAIRAGYHLGVDPRALARLYAEAR